MVTVYSQPGCMPCRATMRYLDKAGHPYTEVDVSQDAEARDYVIGLGHQQTPVVVSPIGTWSGFSPTMLDRLAA